SIQSRETGSGTAAEVQAVRRAPSTILPALLAAAALAAGAGAAEPRSHPLLVGAVEDSAKYGAPGAYMGMARGANFRVVVLSSVGRAPRTSPDGPELERLATAARAARNRGITPVVAVYQLGRDTPLTADARAQFVQYAVAIVHAVPRLRYMSIGNE